MTDERYAGIEGSDRPVVPERPLPSNAKIQFRGVLLKPVDQQADRDGDQIDPAGVEFDPDEWVSIFPNFDYSRLPIGRGLISKGADGSLIVDGEMFGSEFWGVDLQPKLAIGIKADKEDRVDGIFCKSVLMSVALTKDHIDPTQPPIEVIADGGT